MAEEKIEQTQLNDNEQNQTVEYIKDNIIHLDFLIRSRISPGQSRGYDRTGQQYQHSENGQNLHIQHPFRLQFVHSAVMMTQTFFLVKSRVKW